MILPPLILFLKSAEDQPNVMTSKAI